MKKWVAEGIASDVNDCKFIAKYKNMSNNYQIMTIDAKTITKSGLKKRRLHALL
jgi:hypothetical protein